MKCYSSFLVRCWLIGDEAQGEKAVIGVEHIQSGTRTRVASLAEAEQWMCETCRNARPAAEDAARSGPKQEGRVSQN